MFVRKASAEQSLTKFLVCFPAVSHLQQQTVFMFQFSQSQQVG